MRRDHLRLRVLLPDAASKRKLTGQLASQLVRYDTEDTSVVIYIPDQEDAIKASEILREADDIEWEVVGPRCPDHGEFMVSAYDNRRVLKCEIWKCFAPRCFYVVAVEDVAYMTMQDLLRRRREDKDRAGTVTGRLSVSQPNFDLEREKQDPGKAFDLSADFEAIEQNVLHHLLSTLMKMPKNWRQYKSLHRAAEALQRGEPVAFEATPEGTDKMDEAVCRARSRNFRDGEFVVQLAPGPMSHVMPDKVLEMARDLKDAAKELRLGREVRDLRPPIIQGTASDSTVARVRELASQFELSPPGVVPITMTRRDPEREQIEAAKAMMLGTLPKNATVLDVVAIKANEENQNKDIVGTAALNESWLKWALESPKQVVSDQTLGRELNGRWRVNEPPGPKQIPREPTKLRNLGKVIGFSTQLRQACTPDQAAAVLEAWKAAWPELADHFKWARMAITYGMGERRYLHELAKRLDLDPKNPDTATQLEELKSKNEKLVAENVELHDKLTKTEEALGEAEGGRFANRIALNLSLAREEQLKEAMRKVDALIQAVAGMNIQDQPLSVQREVREALTAAMKAVKGEDPA